MYRCIHIKYFDAFETSFVYFDAFETSFVYFDAFKTSFVSCVSKFDRKMIEKVSCTYCFVIYIYIHIYRYT